jgi:dTDP-4-dehydrorhamnose 3,5-epimerase
MIFRETRLKGAFVVELEPRGDERGFFARAFCRKEFEAHGLEPTIAQANISFNYRRGTVRGLHFQFPPAAETKFVRCSRGAIVDVIVDLRPESPTYLQHVAVELTAANRRGLYVPQRFAHGYQVLEDDTETTYQVGEFYTPAAEGGLRYSDPRLAIEWPLPVTDMSPKDREWRLLDDAEAGIRARMTLPLAAYVGAR